MNPIKAVISSLIFIILSWVVMAQESESDKIIFEESRLENNPNDAMLEELLVPVTIALDTTPIKKIANRFEIGINISPILQRIVSPASAFNSNGEYLATFGIKLNNRMALRSGLNVNTFNVESDDGQSFTNSFTDVNARLGLEWKYSIAKWIEMHIGTDITYDKSKSVFKFGTGDDRSVIDQQGWGLGIPIGATFWITDRFGLWFETSIRSIWTKNESFDEVSGEVFNNGDSSANTVTIDLPASIFAKFMF